MVGPITSGGVLTNDGGNGGDPRGCGAVNIFTWGHPKFSNGDHVRVEGVFETVHHQDRSIFYNQVEATKVVPLPK